jgi:hypothetical protein
MKRFLVAVILLCGCDSAKKMIGIQTAEEKAASIEQLQKQMKDADLMVQRYADELPQNPDGGFKKETSPVLDPWGNVIKVDYTQDWFTEIATISSAGPDGKFDTTDDLKRVRTASNPAGVFNGLPTWVWIVTAWISCGMLALLLGSGISHRRKASGKSTKRQPLLYGLVILVAAPLVLFVHVLQFFGGLAFEGEFFDGFDFEFD